MIRRVFHRVRRHTISFQNAFSGLWYAYSTQPNFAVHTIVAILAIFLGWRLAIGETEWLILTFTIVLVFVAEMINTALESICDLVTQEWRQSAKIAKDISAAMVLVVAIGAVVVGLVIFGKYIMLILNS
ncbi:diacylglycerol kinase family protein [Candidatus Daviesbacteria bacterium]|nr:diacylglycerol kinase family protein [Candidatus Daviesbacteria bacterium]